MHRLGLALVREALIVAVAAGVLICALRAALHHQITPISPARIGVPRGSVLRISGVNFVGRGVTLVIAISPQCRFCIASKPFHRILSQRAAAHRIPVLVLIPHGHASEEYLEYFRSAALVDAEIREADFWAMGIPATPALLLVDSSGAVTESWTGKLTNAEEKLVLARIGAASSGERHPTDLSEKEFAALQRRLPVTVLDVRTREEFSSGRRPESVNIPLDELAIRAETELDPARNTVVDCSRISSRDCLSASGTLVKGEFSRISLLNRGSYVEPPTCTRQTAGASP